ncbi:MAG: peptide ABC transporter substrate-binding protein [Treponema sp.]|nr:peptide ABC transporter substrate-binding protein [Treponema sp.]
MNFKNRFFLLTFSCLIFLCPVVGSHSQDSGPPRPWLPHSDEMTVVFSAGDRELDFRMSYMASEAQIFTAIYEGLFSYHPITMEPIPAVASRWELSTDRREWTFTIRENARYQNGDLVRAQDFRDTWLSLLEPGRNAPYSSLFDIIEGAREYRLDSVSVEEVGIRAPSDRTLIVRLNSPAAFFLSMLCHHSFGAMHPSMLSGDPSVPISNGPFYIEEMNEHHIVLNRNPYYWDSESVSLSRLDLRFAIDGDEAASMWNSGEARWIHGDVNYDALTDNSGIQVNAMFATYYFYVRSLRKPWDDFRLRRALSLALPWDEIRENHLLPAISLIPPIPSYPDVPGLAETDIEEAERLLVEAGFPGGEGLPELVVRITPSREASRIAYLMAASWYTHLGVPVSIDVVPFSDYLQSLKDDDYDVGSISWIGDFADPHTFLQMWMRDSNLNDAHHDDEDFEILMARSMIEEGGDRWDTLAEAESLLLERGNVLPISHNPAVNIINLNEIDGWYHNLLDIHPFKYLSIRARRPLPGLVMLMGE